MRPGHPLERAVGMEYYVSDADGTGGRLRARPEDFRVREREAFDTHSVDADPGDFPYLVLRATLRSWDTNDFARALSDALGISRNRVAWAGTKDKHAVTTQLFTVQGADPDDLPALGDADCEVVGRAGRAIQFGDLAGNEFDVVVRDAPHPERARAVRDGLATFAGDDGEAGAIAVPNYFGQQRFGSRRPVTHEVGLAIARDDWEGAVLAYVGNPSENEPESTREARAFVEETHDWAGALERYPGHLRYERTILHRLAEGDSPQAALAALPWNLQQLFVNAAQSYAFNLMLSERLDRGLPFDRPVEGDVVCFAADAGGFPVPDPDRAQRATGSRVDVMARHCERGRAFVTAPLVGTDTEFAGDEPGDITRSVLDDLDLSPEDFDRPGSFDSAGTRRAIRLATDLELDVDPLSLSFALPRGSYATVVLREFLKTSPLDL